MSDKIKEAAKQVNMLLNEIHKVISSVIKSGVQTEVGFKPRENITLEEQYLRNVKFQLDGITSSIE